jgi:hypothetical protein
MRCVDLEQQDRSLRLEADGLLARHGILTILRDFGQPHLSGSYSLRLMTWRDLDIYLEMQSLDTRLFLELGKRLGHALKPRKLSFTDHVNFPTTEAVSGLYWGIQTDSLSGGGWKLDIWGVSPPVCAERLAHVDLLKEAMSPQMRLAILRIKNEICQLPSYRDTITSQHVYDAVLRGGANSVEDFWRFIDSQKNPK